MKKKHTILFMLLAFVATIAHAQFGSEFEAQLPSGQTLRFRLADDIATIVGTYTDLTGNLTIPGSVTNGTTERLYITTIPDSAFAGCTGLTSVTFSEDSLYSIGRGAFAGCTGLTEITIPRSLSSLSSNAFSGCSNLRRVNYNATHCSMNMGSLAYCDVLTIGEDVEYIDNYAFYNCNEIDTIYYNAANATPQSNDWNSSVRAFSRITNNAGVTLVMGPSVNTVGEYMFDNFSSLRHVIWENNNTDLGSRLFSNCSNIKTLTITSDVNRLKVGQFTQNVESCTTLYYHANNVVITSNTDRDWDAQIFRSDYSGGIRTINIVSGVTSLPKDIFRGM